jgi:hypothetical protein
MKGGDLIRVAIVLATLGYVFGGGGVKPDPEPPAPIVEPYTGSMTGLHQTSRSMAPEDREVLADAFDAGGDMVNADGRGLIKTTEKAQDFVVALLEFDFNGIYKPTQRYPSLADAVQGELEKCLGDEIKPMDASDRSRFAACLDEMGRALR